MLIELAPEFNGKEAESTTASNGPVKNGGIQVWSDASDSYFSNLPNYLIGQTFFRMPKMVDGDDLLNITVYQASTLFIAMETSSADTSEWVNSLAKEEWVQQKGTVNTSLVNLDLIVRKDIMTNDINHILFPKINFELKAVIFVTGKLSKTTIYHFDFLPLIKYDV